VLTDLVLLLLHLWGSACYAMGGRFCRDFVAFWGPVPYEGRGPGYRRLVAVPLLVPSLVLLALLARMAIVEYAALPKPGMETPQTIGSRHRLDLAEWKPESPQTLNLADRDLRYADFSAAELDGIDFRGANLSFADFTGASLVGARFGTFEGQPSRLVSTVFDGADLRGADFAHARLRHSSFRAANLTAANLAGADLRWTHLDDASLPLAVLSRAMLERVEAPRVDLFAADLGHAFLTGANLEQADLRLAKLTRARVRGLRLFAAAAAAVEFPSEGDGMDLRRACLQRSVTPALVWLDLRLARLAAADLRGSELAAHVDLRQIDYETRLNQERVEERLALLEQEPAPGVPAETYRGRLVAAQERWRSAQRRSLKLPDVGENLNLVLSDPGSDQDAAASGEQAAFRFEWARQMARLSCRNVYLAEAFVRRAAGVYRPRDPQLERELATALARSWGSPHCAPMDDVNVAAWDAFCDEWRGALELEERCRMVDESVAERGLTPPAPAAPPAPSRERPPPCPPAP
jgi:uncharacterized protein YjbI with pentapeptide repeats